MSIRTLGKSLYKKCCNSRKTIWRDFFQGREILRKDNLIDENAPVDTKTPEELAEELLNTVGILQTRLARIRTMQYHSAMCLSDLRD